MDVFPEFAPPLVEIQTPSLGLSAAEVESLVTVPLEESLAGLPNLETMRSKSVPDLSSIKLYFERGTDLLDARQLVQERLKLANHTLPSWSSPPVLVPPLSATSRMLKIGISSDKLSVIDLSMITYWTIRQRLLRVPGVANIAIWGERIEMLQVQADPERMEKHQVTLDEILEATSDSLDVGLYKASEGHHVGTGGWIETPNQRIPIRHVLPYVHDKDNVDPEPMANTVLKVKEDGTALLMKDVADVKIDHQLMIGDGVVDDVVGLLLIVEKFPWGNTLQVTRDVEAAMDANPDLAAAWLAVEASEARVAPQGAWADPMLSFGLMNRPVAGFGTGERMTMNTLQLSQRIPWPGKLGARTDRATLLARAQSADAVGLERDVVERVTTLYYAIAALDRSTAVLRETRELLDGFFAVSSTRYALWGVSSMLVSNASPHPPTRSSTP